MFVSPCLFFVSYKYYIHKPNREANDISIGSSVCLNWPLECILCIHSSSQMSCICSEYTIFIELEPTNRLYRPVIVAFSFIINKRINLYVKHMRFKWEYN